MVARGANIACDWKRVEMWLDRDLFWGLSDAGRISRRGCLSSINQSIRFPFLIMVACDARDGSVIGCSASCPTPPRFFTNVSTSVVFRLPSAFVETVMSEAPRACRKVRAKRS